MIAEIDHLVSRFERGQLPRRDFLGALLLLAHASGERKPRLGPQARNLTHINIRVDNVKESERFYRELLGLPPARPVDGPAFVMDLQDGSFISLCQVGEECGRKVGAVAGELDHFGVGVDDFKEGETARRLHDKGLEVDDAGPSVFVKDPRGPWVQLSAPGFRG